MSLFAEPKLKLNAKVST